MYLERYCSSPVRSVIYGGRIPSDNVCVGGIRYNRHDRRVIMADQRFKNSEWKLGTNSDGTVPISHCQTAVLMDIRDELQRLNSLLRCYRFIGIPNQLEKIVRNTAKRRGRQGPPGPPGPPGPQGISGTQYRKRKKS